MRLIATLFALAALLLAPAARTTRAYTLQYTSTAATTQVRWPTTTITVALSTSLNNPPAHVRATGAQVVLAARRALARWALASNIRFNVTTSGNQDVGSDGVSLITIADTPTNQGRFTTGVQPGRALVFFDTAGNIFEADLTINPLVTRFDAFGQQVRTFFSTDGADGSYDLESTFVHEIGHMLGLEHSGVLAATMQPRQGTNGTFNLPNFTTRTLASDDVAGIRSIYGPRTGLGGIAGRVSYNSTASTAPAAFGAHVFAEDAATGRLVAGNVANAGGNYRIDGLPPGQYRVVVEYLDEPVLVTEIGSNGGGYPVQPLAGQPPFLTTEAGTFAVGPEATTPLSIAVPGVTPSVNPRFIGTGASFQLSTVAVPVVPGQAATILIGGENVTLAPNGIVAGVTVNSGFIPVTNVRQLEGFGIPVIAFDISPSVLTPSGEYSVRVTTTAGQAAYVTGGLTVDLPNGVPAGQNLADNSTFFVAQHYRDFLGREPDAEGLAFWVNDIESCGADARCREAKRINVSAAFFLSIEFQETGYLVYRFYKAAFGAAAGAPVPARFQQLVPDTQEIGRGVVVNQGDWRTQLEQNKQAFALRFVQRPEFAARYPTSLTPAQFVDALYANAGVTPSADERQAAIGEFGGAGNTADVAARARALRRVAESEALKRQEFNRAFVLMQYFGYLRRNPDDPPEPNLNFEGYNFWLAKLNEFNGDYIAAEMIRAFINSAEYRQRFGS